MNGKKYFVFVGPPGSLHQVVADIVWSGLRVEKIGAAGRHDFDFGGPGVPDVQPFSLSDFYRMLSVMAQSVPLLLRSSYQIMILTGHPSVRIPCISSYSCEVPLGLAWQCVQSLNPPQPSLIFVIDAKDEIIRGRLGAMKENWNHGTFERIVAHYREIKESGSVVRMDTSEGPREAADNALERIRKVI